MNTLIVGTRGSQLARTQSELFQAAVRRARPDIESVEIKVIRTRGDQNTDRPIHEIGDKRLFTKELEAALLAGTVDVAVHSGKDVTYALPPGLSIGAVLPRADRADVFCSKRYGTLDELPPGARVGSGSVRRTALMKRLYPAIAVLGIRGNVDTRLRRLGAGEFDGILLAASGLERLGRSNDITQRLDPNVFMPAPAQGAIVVEYRRDRSDVKAVLDAVNDPSGFLEVQAERALLERLEAGCSVPLGAYAEVSGDRMRLRAGLFRPDGSSALVRECEGDAADPVALGWELAKTILQSGGKTILEECYEKK